MNLSIFRKYSFDPELGLKSLVDPELGYISLVDPE